MADIVDLKNFRDKGIGQKVFAPWKRRFGNVFSQDTRLSDLPDKTLFYLAQPGEKSAEIIYELILASLGSNPSSRLENLEKGLQLRVMDIHLFLADLFRFEMMRRLGWIEALSCASPPLIELVVDFDKYKNVCRENPPELCATHPDHGSYANLHERDKEGYVRRLLPGALEIFKRKIGG